MFEDFVRIWCRVADRHDGEADPLAEASVGYRKRRRLFYQAMPQRSRFDRRWMDVAAAANDYVLLAPGDAQIAGLVELPEIAGHEPPCGVERRFGRRLVVEIAEHQPGAAAADLAGLARCRFDIKI